MEVKRTDRRQDNIFVDNERRSGFDRREKKRESIFVAFETIPTVRRLYPIPEKVEKGDIVPALGMASLAAINLPEDMRDIGGAINQFRGKPPSYDHFNFQHSFSFFKGTAIEKWLYKQIKEGKKWAKYLQKKDITLASTSFGEKILNIVGADESDSIVTSIENFAGKKARAYSYSGSLIAEVAGRALRRTTVLGIVALSILEIPKIFNAKRKINQIEKSAVNVASITAGIAYGGAIGFKVFGNIGSLVGMGAGAILSNKLSQKAQEII